MRKLFFAAIAFIFAASTNVACAEKIDLDAYPFVPSGLIVVEHQKAGMFEWDPAKVRLYISPNQEGKSPISGLQLREELRKQSVLNANGLDYLLKNPHLIPREWKRRVCCFLFWGTIYADTYGTQFVRYMWWSGNEKGWETTWIHLDNQFHDYNLAVVFVK